MKMRMDAYYYFFEKTGVDEIDLILSAVAHAGKAFHHTEYWQDEAHSPEGHDGETAEAWIQNAANKAAAKFNKRLKTERQDFSAYDSTIRFLT